MCMKSIYLINHGGRHVESCNLEFKNVFKKRLDELEHPVLIADWTINMDKDSYKKQAKLLENIRKSIITLAVTTGKRLLNKSFCGSYFGMFWFLQPIICQNVLIIRYFNKFSRYFLSSKFNFNLLNMRWQKFQFSAIVAKKQ